MESLYLHWPTAACAVFEVDSMNACTNAMNKKLLIASAILIPVGIFLAFTVDPTSAAFYPKCIFYWLTGFHCPGCGTARCLHALAHGHFLQAIAFNILTVICLAFFLYWFARSSIRAIAGKDVPPTTRSLRISQWVMWVLIAFWILRNIPVYPFTLLAPHVIGGN